MKKRQFKQELIKELIKKIPQKVKDLELQFPPIQGGWIRFEGDDLKAIYLKDIKSTFPVTEDGIIPQIHPHMIIKFDYNNSEFSFNKIYDITNNNLECGYNSNLEKISMNLGGFNILDAKFSEKHLTNVLNEWKQAKKIFETDNDKYITTFQVEKNGENVKNAYIVCQGKPNNVDKLGICHELIDNFSFDVKHYGAKGEGVVDGKIIINTNIFGFEV